MASNSIPGENGGINTPGTAKPVNGTPVMSVRALVIRLVVFALIMAAILFLAAGRLDWPMAWAYIILATVLTTYNRLTLLKRDPELITERARGLIGRADAQWWDRLLTPFVALIGPMLMLLVAGLDKRFGWSAEIPLAVQIIAAVCVILSYQIGHWAMLSNRFFSAVVRIQRDRGQTVVTSGPYHYVRHPGYTGAILGYLTIPLMLGSLWTYVPALVVLILVIIRTALEDRTLRRELEGYDAYARRVRYRLLPGIW